MRLGDLIVGSLNNNVLVGISPSPFTTVVVRKEKNSPLTLIVFRIHGNQNDMSQQELVGTHSPCFKFTLSYIRWNLSIRVFYLFCNL